MDFIGGLASDLAHRQRIAASISNGVLAIPIQGERVFLSEDAANERVVFWAYAGRQAQCDWRAPAEAALSYNEKFASERAATLCVSSESGGFILGRSMDLDNWDAIKVISEANQFHNELAFARAFLLDDSGALTSGDGPGESPQPERSSTSAHGRFLALIQNFLGAHAIIPTSVKNDFIIDADGPVRLSLAPEREEIVVSTMAFSAVNQLDFIQPVEIGRFNTYHLFRGGYSLSFHTSAECLLFRQTKALANLEAIGLSTFLESFIARSASCSQWCVDLNPPIFGPGLDDSTSDETVEYAF